MQFLECSAVTLQEETLILWEEEELFWKWLLPASHLPVLLLLHCLQVLSAFQVPSKCLLWKITLVCIRDIIGVAIGLVSL